MKTLCRLMLVGLVAGAAAKTATADGAKVEADKENVVASRLEGAWRPHAELTERLTGRSEAPQGESPSGEIAFKSDPLMAKNLPEKYVVALAKRQARIYMAGTMRAWGKDLPFFLVTISGNPHVLFFLQRDGDRFGNGESFNLVVAPAKQRTNDLLFIGGDFNNEPFRAYERVATEDR